MSLTGSAIFLLALLLLVFGGLTAAALPLGISAAILGLLGIRQRRWGYAVWPRFAWLYAWAMLSLGLGLIVLFVVLNH